jgi:hypothetical protein
MGERRDDSINHQFLLAVIRKQGFHPRVATFFASYLVGRSTTYTWNNFASDPRQADVGVGQGSALSPVLSALVIAPLMKLYNLRAVNLALRSTLISYVDDGTVLVQSKEVEVNCRALAGAYAILFLLFTNAGLVLEHDKTELFHFTRGRTGFDLPVDLGFAPYTGATPLKPKTYWRYLGFFFDRKLTFVEHLRFYTTKALTTVMAMRMLGNASRGLSPRNKRILYRACVLPIATYGHRLWFFDGAKVKGVLQQLTSMQRKAALWIVGAFRTSPTGGVEALAGLIPIRLHLEKLSKRAVLRTATLSGTHPLRSLLDDEFRVAAQPHFGASRFLPEGRRRGVRDTITETGAFLSGLTEEFEPCAAEASPGSRLLDRFPDRVKWLPFAGGSDAVLELHRTALDDLYWEADSQDFTVQCGTDCSVPTSTKHQAAAAYCLRRAGHSAHRARWVAGRVLPADAELFAIRGGILRAVSEPGCTRVVVFTDCMAAAKAAVDPSVHSGQAHSLAVCKALAAWFELSPSHSVTFAQAPSKLEWRLQNEAHSFARGMPSIPSGSRPATTLDSMRKRVTQTALDKWTSLFRSSPEYRGSQFLELQDTKGSTLAPVYANGGTWLPSVNEDNPLCARLCRAILGHAPIGEYYRRFNIAEDHFCTCGAAVQTRHHIFEVCPDFTTGRTPKLLRELIGFLKSNPTAFAFHRPAQGIG